MIMEIADRDHSGAVDFNEFMIVIHDRRRLLSDSMLEMVFKQLDRDRDGNIDLCDINEIFSQEHKFDET